jgi:hypothetical protein
MSDLDEDALFRAYLVDNGYDTSMMGLKDEIDDEASETDIAQDEKLDDKLDEKLSDDAAVSTR